MKKFKFTFMILFISIILPSFLTAMTLDEMIIDHSMFLKTTAKLIKIDEKKLNEIENNINNNKDTFIDLVFQIPNFEPEKIIDINLTNIWLVKVYNGQVKYALLTNNSIFINDMDDETEILKITGQVSEVRTYQENLSLKEIELDLKNSINTCGDFFALLPRYSIKKNPKEKIRV